MIPAAKTLAGAVFRALARVAAGLGLLGVVAGAAAVLRAAWAAGPLAVAIAVLGAAVAVAAACHVNQVDLWRHRAAWVFSYGLAGLWAAMEVHDAVAVEARISALVGLAAVGLWIWGSRSTWRNGAPAWLERVPPPARPAGIEPPSPWPRPAEPNVAGRVPLPTAHRWPAPPAAREDE